MCVCTRCASLAAPPSAAPSWISAPSAISGALPILPGWGSLGGSVLTSAPKLAIPPQPLTSSSRPRPISRLRSCTARDARRREYRDQPLTKVLVYPMWDGGREGRRPRSPTHGEAAAAAQRASFKSLPRARPSGTEDVRDGDLRPSHTERLRRNYLNWRTSLVVGPGRLPSHHAVTVAAVAEVRPRHAHMHAHTHTHTHAHARTRTHTNTNTSGSVSDRPGGRKGRGRDARLTPSRWL
jgi:hypothetical protein